MFCSTTASRKGPIGLIASGSSLALALALSQPVAAQQTTTGVQAGVTPGSGDPHSDPVNPSSPAKTADQTPQAEGAGTPASPGEQQQPSTDQSATSGDIIVTATRQSSAVSKVPISITALNQDSLDVQGVKRIDDIATIAPGINFVRPQSSNAGNRVQISIRGVESNVGASTTGIYVDDTPIQTRNAGFTSTSAFPVVFDLDRVEVLRGPQGTLFGAGSEGGTVRFITPQPSLERYSVYGRAEVSSTRYGAPSYESGLAVGGPIVNETLGFRVSGFYRRDGGWIDAVNPATGARVKKNANSSTALVLRGALTWKPASNFSLTPSIIYQRQTATNGPVYYEALSNPDHGVFVNANTLISPSRDKFTLSTLRADWTFGSVELISNTSYLDRHTLALPDYTNFLESQLAGQNGPVVPGEYTQGIFVDEQKGFTQEVRLQSATPGSRLNWVLGVFYNRTKQLDNQVVSSPLFPQIVLKNFGIDYLAIFGTPLGANNSVYTDIQNTVDKQIAGFGQVDYNITSRLKATAGLRYAKVDFSFRSSNEGPIAGVSNATGNQHEKPVTPKFGLSYQADPSNLFYASASKGFRPGGAQRVVPSTCAADLAALGINSAPGEYRSDSVWSYEVGAKNKFAGNKLQINTSAFWIDWKNIQQQVQLNGCGQTFVANLGKAVSRGFDLDVSVRPVDGLTLSALVGYTDAHSTATITSGPATIARSGNAISSISPWRAHVSGQYDFNALDRNAFVRLDYDYASRGPKPDITVFGTDPILFRRPTSNMLDARAGIELGRVSLQAFVNNLTNYNSPLSRYRPTFKTTVFTNSIDRPRTIGLTVIARY